MLGEYALTLCQRGPGAARTAFPEVVEHLEATCAACESELDYFLHDAGDLPGLSALHGPSRRHERVDSVFTFGGLRVDAVMCRVTRDGRVIELSASEFSILRVLAEAAGEVVTNQQLLASINGPSLLDDERALVNVYIHRIRKKIEPDPGQPIYLHAVAGGGYRLAYRGTLSSVEPGLDLARRSGLRESGFVPVGFDNVPVLEAQLFGPFVLRRNGELVPTTARKVDRALELLILLILHPAGLPQTSIAECVWPGLQLEAAAHNVQMAAHALRQYLGSKAAVCYRAGTYQLNTQLQLVADVRIFDTALARARTAKALNRQEALSTAVSVYRGPLLENCVAGWAEPVRLEYRARFASAALELSVLLAHTDPHRSTALEDIVRAISPESVRNLRRSGRVALL